MILSCYRFIVVSLFLFWLLFLCFVSHYFNYFQHRCISIIFVCFNYFSYIQLHSLGKWDAENVVIFFFLLGTHYILPLSNEINFPLFYCFLFLFTHWGIVPFGVEGDLVQCGVTQRCSYVIGIPWDSNSIQSRNFKPAKFTVEFLLESISLFNLFLNSFTPVRIHTLRFHCFFKRLILWFRTWGACPKGR